MASEPRPLQSIPTLQQLFPWHPWPIPDPGPEIWALLHTLPETSQQAALKVVAEANAKMHDLRAAAIRDIGNIAAGKTR
jgi:hypothetical protein